MKLSIIIPIANISQNPFLDDILNSLSLQSFTNFEVILVVGDNRQGRAINKGAYDAAGDWIITMDDDTKILDNHLVKKLIDKMESNNHIGLGGASCIIPENASHFQKKAMLQIPRRFFPIQKDNVESDFVQHPCLIIKRQLFFDIGGEDEELIRGLDPILRKKVRDAGKKVSIIADTAIVHLLPGSIYGIFKMYWRNGKGSAFASKFYKDRVLELSDGYDKGNFVLKRPVYYRIVRRFFLLIITITNLHWIRLASDAGYVMGWIEGFLFSKKPEREIKIIYTESPAENRGNFILRKIHCHLDLR